MATEVKIDSNTTGLAFAEEVSLGKLPAVPGDAIWYPVDPNSYSDFGAEISTVVRNPINKGRQRKKGVPVDVDASGGFQLDLTQDNVQRILRGFMFADFRRKVELVSTAVDVDDGYAVSAGGADYVAGDLLFAKGFTSAANNGLKVVTASSATDIEVAEAVVTEAGADGTISRAGRQFGAGALAVSKTGGQLPRITSGSVNFTTLGLIPGEWIYIGGDLVANRFAQAANAGYARIREIAAGYIVLDKTDTPFVTDAGTGKTIRLFFGRVLRNEIGPLIKRYSYCFERQLGAPDDAAPEDVQAEYLRGAVPNTLGGTLNTADKITLDLTYVALDAFFREASEGILDGVRPELVDGELFNTTSNVARIGLGEVSDADSETDPLFAYVTDLSFEINNNVSLNKAIGYMGGFAATAGTFEVSGQLTAYFNDVRAVKAVRDNRDMTFDLALWSDNAGIVMDMPLLGLGDGRLNVEQDEPITLPLSMDAGEASKIAKAMNYTLMFVFFDYLPNAAAKQNLAV